MGILPSSCWETVSSQSYLAVLWWCLVLLGKMITYKSTEKLSVASIITKMWCQIHSVGHVCIFCFCSCCCHFTLHGGLCSPYCYCYCCCWVHHSFVTIAITVAVAISNLADCCFLSSFPLISTTPLPRMSCIVNWQLRWGLQIDWREKCEFGNVELLLLWLTVRVLSIVSINDSI